MIVPLLSRFLQAFALGLFVPVCNLLVLSRGLDLAGLGRVWAIAAAVVVTLELPTGVLADLVGRKRTYLASLATLAPGAVALAAARGFAGVAVALGLVMAARALSSGSIEALFIDRALEARGPDRLHGFVSALSVAEGAGIGLGSLAGGLVPMAWRAIAPGDDPYSGNLLLMAAVAAAHFVLVATLVPRDRPVAGGRPGALAAFARDTAAFLRGSPSTRLLLAGTAAWGLCFNAIELLWQPRLAGLLGSSEATWVFGLLSAGYFLAGMAGSAASGPLRRATRASAFATVAGFRLLCGALFALLAAQGSVPGFAALYLLMFASNGAAGPSESVAFNLGVPSERRASLLSVSSLAMQAGGGLGSVCLAALARAAGVPAAWSVAGGILAASAGLYALAGRAARRAAA